VVAFLSDIFDGILARRLGVATANLRRLDSAADSAYVGIAADLEGLAISLILLTWQADVPTIFHAYRRNRSRRIGCDHAADGSREH
jgi:phosphatidylglycerophosphate synthase